MRHVSRLRPYVAAHRGAVLGLLVLTVLATVADLAAPPFVNGVVSAITAGQPIAGAVTVLVLVLVASVVVDGVRNYALQRMAHGLVRTLRRSLLSRLLRLPVAEYDARASGDLVSRVSADTTAVHGAVTAGTIDAFGALLTVVGAAVAMLLVDPVLAAVALGMSAIGVTAVVTGLRGLRALIHLERETVGDLGAATGRALAAVRSIRASGATEREEADLLALADTSYEAGMRSVRMSSRAMPLVGMCMQGSLVAVLCVGAARLSDGTLTLGALLSFMLYLNMIVGPAAMLARSWTELTSGLGALQRIEEISDLPPEADAPSLPPADDVPGAPALELRDVDFGYGDRAVTRGVSFAVPPGTVTAVVGPSGCGKSTLFALVERFYDPRAGEIRMNGVDVRALSRSEVRSRIGYVEQEAPVLAGTVRDNLRLGSPDVDDVRMRDVVEMLALHDLGGDEAGDVLDVEVGEGGVRLSGGERQRLAIARALLREPDLLLLDEPTSALDARNETLFRDAVRAVARDSTVLVVAHRLSTVAESDQIVVLDAGRVERVGTHEELLASSPTYRRFAEDQLLAPTGQRVTSS